MAYLSQLRALVGPLPLFSVGASAVVQDEYGRVLLQRRGDDGLWGFPGGGAELGETLEGAARRELREEVGLDTPLRLWHLVSGAPMHHRYPNGDEVYIVGALCRGHLPAAALAHARPDNSGETLDLAWFALNGLPAVSANVNRYTLNLLRAEEGLGALPLLGVPLPPPSGYLARLRAVVGTRPLLVPAAQVQLRNTAGQVLALNSEAGWALPGGPLELGDTFEQAACRAAEQQLGIVLSGLKPLEVCSGPAYCFTAPGGHEVEPVVQVFSAQLASGQAGCALGRWLAADALPTVPTLHHVVG